MWVISDIHLHGKRKDFLSYWLLREFLLGIPDRSLILNGDILDLLRDSYKNICDEFWELLPLLFKKARFYVIGNHDRELLKRGFIFGVPIVETLILGDTVIMHGDQFDFTTRSGGTFGQKITATVAWLNDYVNSKIDVQARRLEGWLRRQGRFGSIEVYREKGLHHIASFFVGVLQVRKIVLGHTHKKDFFRVGPLECYNTGTWENGRSDRIELPDERG